ncbi:MAG: SDR family oxidoreductase [Cryomorphaceae bacterium]
MNLRLDDKTALVAGSTQGIGKAVAIEMAKQGARLILIARNENKLIEVRDELNAINPVDHKIIVADFSDPEILRTNLEDKLKEEKEIHILVNNTGGPPAGKASDAEVDEFRKAFEMHLVCNHILAIHTVPLMKKAGYGRIINVISTSVKQPLPNLGVSNTIRGAVANWAKTLANELGEFNITVNNVLPGPTNTVRLEAIADRKSKATGKSVDEVITDMGNATPMKRVGQPEEVANAICFLASPAASYINGINLPVDGGRTSCL